MPPTTPNQPTDIKDLIEILEWILRLLRWIVFESGLLDEHVRPRFIQVFPDTEQRIRNAASELYRVRSVMSRRYKALAEVGLTGPSLALKVAVLQSLLARIRAQLQRDEAKADSPTAPRQDDGIAEEHLKEPTSWANMILGSMSKVFPPLHAVKEYKEGVELSIKHNHRSNSGYGEIFEGLREASLTKEPPQEKDK